METKLVKREMLNDLGYEDSIVFESPDYDDAIIGTTEDRRVVYSFEKMADCLMREEGMSYEEAVEFIEYNTVRALPYVSSHPEIVYCTDVFNEEGKHKYVVKFDAKKETDKCVKWIRDWFEKNGNGCNAIIGISGGKDSTVMAALCVRALGKDRVIGISMPDENQGTNSAEEICDFLGIKYYCIPIDGITGACKFALTLNGEKMSEQAEQNIPPRVRMTVLYGFSQSHNGRVMGTCNASENYVGYFTRYGDGASDVEPIGNFTVAQVKAIGYELGLPKKWVDRVPDDGLPNSCPDDEKFAKWGFSYALIDKYLTEGTTGDDKVDDLIEAKHNQTKFKEGLGEMYNPNFS